MGEIITIKGNRHGLNVQLDAGVDFDALVQAFKSKLEEGRRFFGKASISIDFTGRDLTDEETETLVETVHDHSDMKVFCVVDEDMPVAVPSALAEAARKAMDRVDETENEALPEAPVVEQAPMPRAETAVFHQGTLRSGQEINVDTGLVIVGDVNPGAKVIAKGNIFVIGQLRGFAHAGYGGSDKACIFALRMAPTQLRIGHVIARSPDRFEDEGIQPQIAFLEDRRITIDLIDRTFYNSFELLK